jgi:hypothetical protein
MISLRSQKVLVWWAVITTAIYGLVLRFLLHMMPPPTAKWSADQIAAFYTEHSSEIKWGATIASWTSAFFVPLAIVVAVQIYRHERGGPVWSFLAAANGTIMSIFLVLPPLFWGVAAYTPTRPAEVTAIMHELGMLTLTTTDQYYIFFWVAVTVISLLPNTVVYSPFPRWYGYFTAWTAIMFEAGAIAFLTRSGPFAWNGLLVFWSPLILFGAWIAVTATLLLKSLNKQIAELQAQDRGFALSGSPAS